MSDRNRNRRNYGDDFDGNASSNRRRTADSTRSGYDRNAQRSASSYSRDSGNYHANASTRASDGAGAYANNRVNPRAHQRPAQSDNASTRRNVFEGYYPENTEDTVDTYRRSAYGSGSSSASGARRRTRSSAQPSRRPPHEQPFQTESPVIPAQASRGGRGAQSRTAGPQGSYAPKRSNRKRNAIIAVVVVLAVVLVGAGAAWAYVRSIDENLHRGVTQETLDALEPAEGQLTETSLGDAPFYMLLLGIDLGEARRQEADYAGDKYGRTDSMILARIDPVNKKVALISVHRDTMVDLGEYGQQKINAAFEFYGPAGAIQAVSTMAGVPISHYATVDFDGFRAIVDTLGGIEVNVPMEINDDVLPCHIDAGLQTLDGEQALNLCRSRHSYDDVADDGDVMRAANQRMVIGTIAKKILSSDVMTIANSVQTLSKYVTTDLSVSDIIGLAQLFQGVNPDEDIYTAMEPTTSAYIDETWYEYLDEAEWREMIERMDQGLPPVNKTEIDERTGTILSTGGADAPVV